MGAGTGKKRLITKEHEGSFGDNKNLFLDYGGQYKTVVKIHRTLHLKRVNFTICKLYLKKRDVLQKVGEKRDVWLMY